MKKKYLLLFSILFVCCSIFGQSKKDIQKITANYNIKLLKEKEVFYREKARAEKKKAIAVARAKNWPIYTEKEDGSISELMKLSPEGLPIYYATDNVNAAKTTRTNHLNTGGSLGLNLNGQGMTVREWDGGNVRASHTAFGGRVTVVDDGGTTTVFHSTHVAGTLVAAGSPAAVKGMAWQANARTFNWDDDDAEAISEAVDGMLISNHSYGVPITSNGVTIPSWFIGSYSPDAVVWDDIAYNAPYFLAVMSAGNDGQTEDNPEPMAFGFDKLVSNKTAKNNLVVASCEDVNPAADGTINAANVDISGFSSQGPTDDHRVKPDITGNGENLTSTSNTSNTATGASSGTSMASPNVAGTLVLIQQHYKNLTNSFMRSATLKGLVCHTADDGGNPGPDPSFGWGILNAKKAVETLTNNGLSTWVSEENLNNHQALTMNVNASGTTPLIASITWTDVPGEANVGNLPANDPTPALVNDLDIRITKNTTTYFPWKLGNDPSADATRTGDNSVDNVEQVKIDAPTAGLYTITVTHKGTLVTGSQKYSLVITGLSSPFALNSTSDNLTVCANQNAVYTFNYTQSGSGTTTFSAVDLPSGASASFAPASLSANGTVTMTISGLNNVAPNEYFVGIKGTSATDTETRYKSLRIFNATFQPIALQSPTNGQSGLSTSANLTWAIHPNAQTYNVQVSTFPDFSSFVQNDIVTDNEYSLDGLNEATRYYWRVIPSNSCGNGTAANASTYSFATGTLTCNHDFVADDFSNNVIADVPNSEATVPVTVTGGYTIGDLNVSMDITHTWIGDITVTLQGPAAIGSPIITLLDIPCGDFQNINCIMDDDGSALGCAGNPAVSGTVMPVDPLSSLNTLPADGEWTLRVFDHNNEDGGTINSFSINLCSVENALSVVTNPFLNSSVYPNPTKGIVNVSIPGLAETATIKLFDLQGRQILSKETNQVHTSFGIDNLQDGIYLVNIENEQASVTKKIILRRN
ncbi:S8 family serine peptidase [Flavobacterium wongokense]|uniref:S8 family serine peptidase n=1 Tax=Flavobacterium wongokense TaxID=2910674 RepID=UPI001F202A78|nr:S8 family serine peptidase [Flavobacterium sp. WG47]MCF6131547.1 S8 family serine peptidase [Flavobacterium sp. WG47]